jgi:hypothetical protein
VCDLNRGDQPPPLCVPTNRVLVLDLPIDSLLGCYVCQQQLYDFYGYQRTISRGIPAESPVTLHLQQNSGSTIYPDSLSGTGNNVRFWFRVGNPPVHRSISVSVVSGPICSTPTVQITHPAEDTTIILTPTNQPTITFQETHSPGSGDCEPFISWENGPVLETSQYWDQLTTEGIQIPVIVTATNQYTAQDTVIVTLKCSVPAPNYKQTDSQWADSIYDATQDGIHKKGCAVSSAAIVLTAFGHTTDPGELNNWMKRPRKQGGYRGQSVNWEGAFTRFRSLAYDYADNSGFGNQDSARSPSLLDNPLSSCRLVIVQVRNSRGGQHWVVVTGKQGNDYTIRDPGYPKTLLSQYESRFWKYVVVPR